MIAIARRRLFTWLFSLPSALVASRKPSEEIKLAGSFDARDWAKAFVAVAKSDSTIPTDEETMVTWFANAIMAGYDERERSLLRSTTVSVTTSKAAVLPRPDRKRYAAPPTLWYEDEAGNRFIPDREWFQNSPLAFPAGFPYQRSQFPRDLHDSCCTKEGPVCGGTSSWSEDLVFAMAHDGYSLSDAILVVGNLCERCLNAAIYDYRLNGGYSRDSEQWKRANTKCEFCMPPKRWMMREIGLLE